MADRIEAIAIDGLGEIVPGDDLPSLIADAVAAASDVLPLRDDDALVVTQKIVSKAEGAVVDLTTIEPSPVAQEFARRHDRDPRQVEVVLREAKRVVRMANGVIITETHHGFVCANGGIDASNVGPASGSIVTLLPKDPDASADRIRAALRERLGQDVPVVVSDSFGRPWRLGIVDVAIGVSGLLPLDDLRGTARRRWPGHAVDGPRGRRRAGLGRGARPGQDRSAARSRSFAAHRSCAGKAASPTPCCPRRWTCSASVGRLR